MAPTSTTAPTSLSRLGQNSEFAMAIALFGMLGSKAMLKLWFPLFYLLFAFPLPETLVAAITQPAYS